MQSVVVALQNKDRVCKCVHSARQLATDMSWEAWLLLAPKIRLAQADHTLADLPTQGGVAGTSHFTVRFCLAEISTLLVRELMGCCQPLR